MDEALCRGSPNVFIFVLTCCVLAASSLPSCALHEEGRRTSGTEHTGDRCCPSAAEPVATAMFVATASDLPARNAAPSASHAPATLPALPAPERGAASCRACTPIPYPTHWEASQSMTRYRTCITRPRLSLTESITVSLGMPRCLFF
jgi:hypothetical protein